MLKMRKSSMKSLKLICAVLASGLSVIPMEARDIILEFKAAYFLPTDSDFRRLYKGSALYGPELTVQIANCRNWYAFASLDYFQKKGRSCGFCSSTKVSLLPLGLGLKYFVPTCYEKADFYVGLGFQPEWARTKDCSSFVIPRISRWGFGGIAKAGMYCHLPCNFLIDLFVDYSFVWASKGGSCKSCTGPVIPLKANLGGAIFGVGLGYRF
jgi:hypothetical protein